MSTGTPGRPRAVRTGRVQETTDVISKFFLPFATAITTAIFYFTAWAYIAHWYGFFGIDASQVNVPLQLILIHGVPGILLLVACGLISLAMTGVIAIFRQVKWDARISSYTIIVASFIAFSFIENLADQLPYVGGVPFEVRLSLTGLKIIVLIMVLVLILAGFNITIEKTFSTAAISFVMQSVVLIYYFFAAFSTSVLLGEWDAARGRRLMVGDWQIPQVNMYSAKPITALSKMEEVVSQNEYLYTRLGLVGSDDHAYYLVEWKLGKPFSEKPEVFVIPRSDELRISYLVNPSSPTAIIPAPTPEPVLITPLP